jgi:hypothetical protein
VATDEADDTLRSAALGLPALQQLLSGQSELLLSLVALVRLLPATRVSA